MKTVVYSRKKVVEAIRTLEEIVVSLDRVGSASIGASRQEADALLGDFIRRHDIFKKAAKARRILSDAFSREVGPDGMDELERQLQDVPHWKPRQKK